MSLPNGSAIPGAVLALMSMASTSLSVSDGSATVWFGKALPAYTNPVTFQIVRVKGDQKPAEIAPAYRREETFMMYCQLIAYQGDADFPTILQNVFTAWDTVALMIGTNPTLNQTVRFAEVKNLDVVADVDQNGKAAVVITFNVACQQRVHSLTGDTS
jgi:hypothetical protein